MKTLRRPRWALPAAGIAVLLAAAFVAATRGGDEGARKEGAARPALTVTLARAEVAELPLAIEAEGNIAPWQETIVGAEVGGLKLVEVRANVGDAVKRGQILAVFAAATTAADLAQQRAAVAVAEAEYAEAHAAAERYRKLLGAGAVSRHEMDKHSAAEQSSKARLDSARAAVTSAEVRLGNTRVEAPDDGTISARSATLGAVAQPGQELFRLIRNDRLEWRAEVTAADLARLRAGQKASLELPGGGATHGTVRVLAPSIDPLTRHALVYVDIAPGGGARSGMFARGRFDLGRTKAVTVPQQSVVVRDGFSYVFSVGSDNRVQQRKARAGRRDGRIVEILEGVQPGEAVVAAGAGFLNDGDLVAVRREEPRA